VTSIETAARFRTLKIMNTAELGLRLGMPTVTREPPSPVLSTFTSLVEARGGNYCTPWWRPAKIERNRSPSYSTSYIWIDGQLGVPPS